MVNDVGPKYDDKYRLIGNQWYISQFKKIVVTFKQSNNCLKICYIFSKKLSVFKEPCNKNKF